MSAGRGQVEGIERMGISKTSFAKGRRKTGGRKAGTPNKVTQANRKVLDKMKVDRTDPMSFFLSVLCNPDAPYEEAKAAAHELMPYSHPKLASLEASTGGMSHEDRLEQLQRMLEDEDD